MLCRRTASRRVIHVRGRSRSPIRSPVKIRGSPPKRRISSYTNGNLASSSEYGPEIYQKLRREEMRGLVLSNFRKLQVEIDEGSRAELVDWLIDMSYSFDLCRGTVFLVANIVDRFLSIAPVQKKSLRLVGLACMLLAAKYEEIECPRLNAYVNAFGLHEYRHDEICQMERNIFQSLDFEIRVPTPEYFFGVFLTWNGCDDQHKELVRFLVELTLVDARVVSSYNPSQIVAAATMLSNEMVGRQQLWPASVAQQSGYNEEDLRACTNELRLIHQAAPRSPLQSVRKRYSRERRHCVALTRTS